jgi:hypothetical protein
MATIERENHAKNERKSNRKREREKKVADL